MAIWRGFFGLRIIGRWLRLAVGLVGAGWCQAQAAPSPAGGAPAPTARRAPAGIAAAAAVLALRDTTREYILGLHWDVLVMNGAQPGDSLPGGLSLAQVRSAAWAPRFRRSRQDVPNYPVLTAGVWLRATVENAAPGHPTWLLRARIASTRALVIYVIGATGQVRRMPIGPAVALARSHAVANRRYNLVLPLLPGERATVYVCAPRGGLLDLTVCERGYLQQVSYWENLGQGVFVGALLMLAVYNLFLFGAIREASYGYYSLYVLTFCALNLQMKDYLFWWFFPYFDALRQELLQTTLIGLLIMVGALMARSFLETRRLVPRLDWLLRGLVVLAPLPLVGLFLFSEAVFFVLSRVMPLLAVLILLVVGTAVLRTGSRSARYYMAGWGALMLSFVAFYLATLNLLPTNGWTMNGSALGWGLEMTFLSLGLADRINHARRAESEAQQRALTTLREKEDGQQAANRQLAARATELGGAYQELRASLATTDHLQTLDGLKTTFFTNISHEFRTPLTLILGPAEELTYAATDPAVRRQSELILRNAQRLLQLINQLLDLSKLEAGAMQFTPGTGDVASLARQVAATFTSLAEAEGIGFRVDGPATLPFVFDAPKLEIILTNLLSNALRFTPAGGEVMLSWSLAPATAAGPTDVALLVRDTGAGIPAADVPRLFDRFYQGAPVVPARGVHAGTGLGLTLVKELTELHGGTVAVASVLGQGTTFVVRLPGGLVATPETGLAPPPHRALLVPRGAALLTVKELDAPPLPRSDADTVLYIEDNDDMRAFIRTSLAPAGYRLLEAPDGLVGVALALAQVPDLIVSDVMMPGLDGYGVVRRLKAHPATSHVPVVLLTARSAAADRLEGLETGADAYLSKPFAARELRAQIRNLLAPRDRTRAATRAALNAAPGGSAPLSADGAGAGLRTGNLVAATPPPVLPRHAPLDEQFLAAVAAAVEGQLAEPDFDVDQLSSAVAFSRTQLQRKLRALTGQSPAEYIRTVRLGRALTLLRERAGSVSEIGYRVGFSSPAHFSTVFSRHFGYPPSDAARG
ncbi:MAG: response regulator [Hymenobacteraceae bacterium]|nr:response regulator [Hymenobacteraceae bacterium]